MSEILPSCILPLPPKVLLHVVQVVLDVPIGDLLTGGGPHALMRHDVFQGTVEMANAMRLAKDEWMNGQAEDPRMLRPLDIKPIESVPNHTIEIRTLVLLAVEDRVVQIHGVGDGYQRRA